MFVALVGLRCLFGDYYCGFIGLLVWVVVLIVYLIVGFEVNSVVICCKCIVMFYYVWYGSFVSLWCLLLVIARLWATFVAFICLFLIC